MGAGGARLAVPGPEHAGRAGTPNRQKITKKVEMGREEGGDGEARAGGHLCRHRAAVAPCGVCGGTCSFGSKKRLIIPFSFSLHSFHVPVLSRYDEGFETRHSF